MKNKKGYLIEDQYATYSLTCTFVGWVDLLTRKELKDLIIECLKYCQNNKGLIIYAYVLMPSHIHIICSAAENRIGISAIIRDFKKHVAKGFVQNSSCKIWIIFIIILSKMV